MIMIRSATTLGYEPAEEGDGVTLQFPGKARGVVQKGLSPTLMCCKGGGGNGVVVKDERGKTMDDKEVKCMRMVRTEEGKKLRKDYENHRVKHGFNEHRQLEERKDDNSNAITTVLKDNLISERTTESIKIKGKSMKNEQEMKEGDGLAYKFINSAQSPVNKQTSPTLLCGEGCGVMTAVKEPIKAGDLHVSEFGQANTVHSIDGVAPTITTCHVGIGQPKIEVVGDLHIPGESETNNRVHGTDGLSPTVQALHKKIIEDKSETIPELQDGEVASMITPGRMEKRQNGKRYKTDGNSFTVTCQDKHGVIKNDNGKLRIRYLTPRECWRLQGFPDWAFDAAKDAGMSKSSLYKQAGNSIAVPCLKAIFKGMFIDKTFHKTQDITRWME